MAKRKEKISDTEKLIMQHLADIKTWKAQGASIVQIRQKLGISESSWYRLYKKSQLLKDMIEAANAEMCIDLKSKLYKVAMGETSSTTIKTVYKKDDNGNEYVLQREVVEKREAPSIAALTALLRNYDTEYDDNPKTLDIKKQQLEVEKIRQGMWSGDNV